MCEEGRVFILFIPMAVGIFVFNYLINTIIPALEVRTLMTGLLAVLEWALFHFSHWKGKKSKQNCLAKSKYARPQFMSLVLLLKAAHQSLQKCHLKNKQAHRLNNK